MQSQNQFSPKSHCHAHFPVHFHTHQHHQFNCSSQSQSIHHHHQPPCPYFHFPVLLLFHHHHHHQQINQPYPLFHSSTTTHLPPPPPPPPRQVSDAQQEQQGTPEIPAPLGQEVDVQAENVEEEEEAEYMFEMTDEWKEFFAKSEAKRRETAAKEKREQQCSFIRMNQLYVPNIAVICGQIMHQKYT